MTISRRCFPCTGKSHGTIGASRRWGGRRIQRSSMSAGCGRAMKPGRRRVRGSSRAGMDPARLLAARLEVRSDGLAIAGVRPSRSGVSNGFGAIRQRPGRRAASRRACGKRPRGAACLVETVHTATQPGEPGCPAPSPSTVASTRRGESPCLHPPGDAVRKTSLHYKQV